MKLFTFQDYRKMEVRQGAFMVLIPALLMLGGSLWVYNNEWVLEFPMQLTNLFTLYFHLY